MSDDETIPDTGLVAAAVTMTAPEPPPPEPDLLPAAVTLAVTPSLVTMPEGWDLHKVAALVTDVAQNMYDLPYLLKKHSLSPEQYAFLQSNEFFKRALEAEVITWSGVGSIQKRLALEAAIAVEAAMPTVAARLSKNTEPLGEVVALLKVLAEIAGAVGVKAQAANQGSGERFKIIINMGAETTEITAAPSFAEVQPQPEGEGTRQALSRLVQAS